MAGMVRLKEWQEWFSCRNGSIGGMMKDVILVPVSVFRGDDSRTTNWEEEANDK